MRKRFVTLLATIATVLMTVPAAADGPKQEYIVVLNPTDNPVADAAQQIAGQHGGEVGFVYTTALQGFTLAVPEPAAAAIERNPRVAYVEPVHRVEAVGTQPIPTGIDRIEGDVNPPSTPMDVDIAILDTGVYIGTNPDGSARSHLDLNLRYVSDCSQALYYPLFGGCSGSGDFQDYNGHGTHVAGIAAALDNDIGSVGTAPGATLWSYKVLGNDGTGTTGTLLAGIDAVASQAAQIEVANMSLGFVGYSQAINDGIASATDAGVTFVVAAGNDAILASEFSPANSPDVITVSALADFDGQPGGLGSPTCRSDVDDTLADFSNYGPEVEIAAPGVCIFSTHLQDGYATYSGTSMASPFVAGAVARYIAESGAPTENRADVDAIKAAVIDAGTPQSSACGFEDIDNSPEPLLFVNATAFGGDGTCGGTTPPDNTAPSASFDVACTDLDCVFTNTSFDPDVEDELSFSWEFGDGASSSESDPTHSYSAGGTYTVTLTVDDGTAQSSANQDVSVSEPNPNQPPSAGFSASCIDLQCDFTDESSDPDEGTVLSYSWDFGDGTSSTQASPSHTYSVAGSYTVELTVSDGEFSDVASTVVDVTDPAEPTSIGGTVNPIISEGREVEVAIAVYDDLGDFVGGATVDGELSYTDRNGREKTATTSAVSEADDIGYNGYVANALVVKKLPPRSTVVGFCITNITAPGYTYVTTGFECWPWGT